MKKKTLSLIISLALAVSLSACGSNASNDKFQSEDNSDAERIAELEQELEELKAQQSQDNDENSDTEQEESQQPVNEAEGLLKTTIESPETSGVCGADLTWYYQNGVLAITGTGEMTDYSSQKDIPWYDLSDEIGWVIIDEGATTIGKNAFHLTKRIGDSVPISKVVLPNTLTSIGMNAFSGCDNITEISLPNTLISIEGGAFGGCEKLEKIIFPDSLTTIGYSVFEGNTNIKEITFKGNIPNGLDIKWFSNFNGSWAEGAVEGYEPTEEDKLRTMGEHFHPMTIYYTGDTFDEFINSYPYWSDYGVNWIKQ